MSSHFQRWQARLRAIQTLTYYLKTIWQEVGLPWDPDHEAEVRNLVEDLVVAAGGELDAQADVCAPEE